MATKNKPSSEIAPSNTAWNISYTQSDVDAIREQIEQTEAAKRSWFVLLLVLLSVALAGAVALLSTSYTLYASTESERERLESENARLASEAAECSRQVEAARIDQAERAQALENVRARIDTLLPAILSSTASAYEVGLFARMLHELPDRRIEIERRPPDRLFRNWRVSSDDETEVFTLVGGFVDGKWVVHSNLVARR